MLALKFTITYFRVLSFAFVCLFAVIGCYCYLDYKVLENVVFYPCDSAKYHLLKVHKLLI